MTEQKCKEFIKNDLQNAVTHCNDLINEIGNTDLIFVDMELNRIMRHFEDAKLHLKGCEDY